VGPFVSAVIPMNNEADNARETIAAVAAAFESEGWTYEIIPVDDGSTDATSEALARAASEDDRVKPVGYRINRGRGYALRKGFAAATGQLVTSLDADLSYSPDVAVRMLRVLAEDPETDVVLASPYMKGGTVEDVPFMRLLLSRAGNAVLQLALPVKIHTSTSIVRAYRVGVLRALDLTSDGKEIHLEILSEALTLGYRVVEIPATLRSRKKGRSKFRPRATVISHLLFTVLERPAWLFAVIGMATILASLPIAAYLLEVFFTGKLNPERPLMTVMVLLFLGGAAGVGFALISMQLVELRRSVVRLRSEMSIARAERAATAADPADEA
jgi:dolichol-phosphate mannosyltransferase